MTYSTNYVRIPSALQQTVVNGNGLFLILVKSSPVIWERAIYMETIFPYLARLVCIRRGALVVFIALAGVRVAAQPSSATLVGTVVDGTAAVLPGAEMTVTRAETLSECRLTSGNEGAFRMTALPPGSYMLRASLPGFVTCELSNIVLNVGERVEVHVEIGLAGHGEGVTVQAEVLRIRTSLAVSTVMDRQFVENLPLNGRSLQALLALTPGIVQTSTTTRRKVGSSASTDNGGAATISSSME